MGGTSGSDHILSKLGGQNGEQGGITAISKLFEARHAGHPGKLQARPGQAGDVLGWPRPERAGDRCRDQERGRSAQLSQVAQRTGMSQDEVADHVAQALPEAVDKATPGGAVPQQGFSMDTLMGIFKK